ncbi:hypothetical protein NDU88_006439 [Pleurodeles waltl]|uniref:Uncharacterized protein n=1 Tax=Pleurodeles waltl TaxID=8319 RepID=A0AAV7NRT8_PLEWA|nr:hypothetical protein NDU88_006439 [Pleurodeles waltl]
MGMEGVLADIRKSLAALAPTAQPGASPTPPPGLVAPASSGFPPVHVPEHQAQEQNPSRAHLAAIRFFAKIRNLEGPLNTFTLRQALVGWARSSPGSTDAGRPVTTPLLEKLLKALQVICSSPAEAALFSAAFALAFYGAFRISELVGSSMGDHLGGLQQSDVLVCAGSLSITLRKSKTDQLRKETRITLYAVPGSPVCPVTLTNSYLAVRPTAGSPALFVHPLRGMPFTLPVLGSF